MDKKIKKDMAMLVLRVVLGTIFMMHGAQKLFGLFNGIGPEGTEKMMEGLGFIYPEITARLWSWSEFLAGGFLILGVVSRYASVVVFALMAINVYKVDMSYGFFVQNGGFEYDLLIMASAIVIVFMGGGRWSVWDK